MRCIRGADLIINYFIKSDAIITISVVIILKGYRYGFTRKFQSIRKLTMKKLQIGKSHFNKIRIKGYF